MVRFHRPKPIQKAEIGTQRTMHLCDTGNHQNGVNHTLSHSGLSRGRYPSVLN